MKFKPKKLGIFLLSIIISLAGLWYAFKKSDPKFSISIRASSGEVFYDLTVGFSPDATDNFDPEFDTYVPPSPPLPAFDAALSWDGDRYYTQILNGSVDDLVEHVYDISLQFDESGTIALSWDNTDWPMLGSFQLTDAFGGVLGIDIDMTAETSLILDNPSFNKLKLMVTPIDLKEFWIHFSSVNYFLLFFAMGLLVFSVLVRAYRWKLLLKPFEKIDLHPLFESTMIGYFGNSVFPFRLGEILRGYSLSNNYPISFSVTFGTIIIERILDMLGLIILIGFVFFSIILFGDSNLFSLFPNWMVYSIGFAVFSTLFIVVLIFLLGGSIIEILNRVQKKSMKEESIFSNKILNSLIHLLEGITSLKKTDKICQILVQSLYLWTIYYVYSFLIVIALDIDIGWIEVGIILVATTLSITVPAAPGYIGTYHFVVVLFGTTLFAMSRPEAQAFAVIAHACGYLPFVILGFYYFMKSSLKFFEIEGEI